MVTRPCTAWHHMTELRTSVWDERLPSALSLAVCGSCSARLHCLCQLLLDAAPCPIGAAEASAFPIDRLLHFIRVMNIVPPSFGNRSLSKQS
jgi:hypothetical protein